MADLRQKITAERKLRELLDLAGLPRPDEIEYGHTCIRAIWWERKRAVVIDLDDGELDPAGEAASGQLERAGEAASGQASALDETLDLDELVDFSDPDFGERHPWAA
jgi:hypothetical protein